MKPLTVRARHTRQLQFQFPMLPFSVSTKPFRCLEINPFQRPAGKAVAVALLCVNFLAACSGSGSDSGAVGGQATAPIDDMVSSEQTPTVLILLSEDDSVLSAVPEVVFTQTLADSGLRVSYTRLEQRLQAPALVIEDQWIHMQACLGVVDEPPLVLIRDNAVEAFTPEDEVILNEIFVAPDFSFVPTASSSTLHGTVIQVIVEDFDGTLGMPNFNLRSIMGRRLWVDANLAARDYPFECARQQP